MNLRKHSHPVYLQWFKKIGAIFAFLYPVYMILDLNIKNVFPLMVFIFLSLFTMMCILTTAYFFQDIWLDEEGLFIEFVWTKIRVKWDDIVEMKGIMFARSGQVVVVKSLTPFHRIFGFLYGFSLRPAFIIYPTISNYEVLSNEIKSHIKKHSH